MIDEEEYLDDNFEEDDQSENPDDYDLSPEDFEELFLIPSDWTVSTIRSQFSTLLDLDPEFQRRGVWSKKAKSRFIESLLLGIPIPQILLADNKGDKKSFIVLDGKQRLLTIKEFYENRFDDGSPFKLADLESLRILNGKTWIDIERDRKFSSKLENATIRTFVVRGWKKESVLYEIFYRLNSGSVKLSPMELRMALLRGDFLRKVVRWTETIRELHSLLRIRKPDKRMVDVELAVRHMAFSDPSLQYRGNLKDFLDNYCRLQNQNFDEESTEKRLLALDKSIAAARAVFGPKAICRRWMPDKEEFDTRFNRAIFDIIIGSFANLKFRKWATENDPKVVEAFQKIFEDDNFVKSVQSTTKSISATRLRFETWYKKIDEISNIKIPMPNIADETS